MPEFAVRPAAKREFAAFAAWYIEERSQDPRFAATAGNIWQRVLFRRWVLPRYLRTRTNQLVLEQDGRTAGFAVAEQAGDTVTLSEFRVEQGFDAPGLLRALLHAVEALARDREYTYVRLSPLDSSPARLALYQAAGYVLLDYYLWSYQGELAGRVASAGLTLCALLPRDGLAERLQWLAAEMDASEIAARAVINSSLLPQRPSPFPSYRIERDGEAVGYVSVRANERDDGVLSLALSLEPTLWGSETETQAALAALAAHNVAQPAAVRVMLSTTAHADQAEAIYRGLGLSRQLDERPLLVKTVAPVEQGG